MKQFPLAVALIAVGIVAGVWLAQGWGERPASAVPTCPGPSAQCPSPTPQPSTTPQPTATPQPTPTPAIIRTYVVTELSQPDQSSLFTAEVFCDAGDLVSGGGFSPRGSGTKESFPIGTTGWHVASGGNQLTGYAVCLDNPPFRP